MIEHLNIKTIQFCILRHVTHEHAYGTHVGHVVLMQLQNCCKKNTRVNYIDGTINDCN